MKKRLIIVMSVLALYLSLVFISSGQASIFDFGRKQDTVTISRSEYERLQRYAQMDEILQYIETWYYEEPDVDALMENATRGLL